MLFTAIRDTYLKKSPTQSSDLPEDQKVFVPEGKSYPIKEYEEIDHDLHFKISIDYGAGDWIIWTPHWDLERLITQPDTEIVDVTKIDWSNPNSRVSKYFTVGEVTNNQSRRIPNGTHRTNAILLAKELDKIREEVGPIRTTSWMRPSILDGYPVDVNRAVGGATLSQHRWGAAVDIYPLNYSVYSLEQLCLQHWRGGVGTAARRLKFIHLDARSGFPCWRQGSYTAKWPY